MQSQGMVPNVEASVSKNYNAELSQRVALTNMHLVGNAGMLRGSKYELQDAADRYLGSVSATIGAGTSEVNRNVIATRGLGLPRC